MAHALRAWRSAAVMAVFAIVSGACGSSRPAGTLNDLYRWQASSTLAEDGAILSATYEDWPMRDAPFAYACTEAPANVFGGDPPVLLVSGDLRCAPFNVSLDGSRLTISIDRTRVPEAFKTLPWWTSVLAFQNEEGAWSQTGVIPASLDGFTPGGSIAPMPTP